jgi:hypothetical protein
VSLSQEVLDTVNQLEGSAILDEIETFVGRFVSYPSEHARVAHVLWIAHTHCMETWESTPRIFFGSPEPGSGKSRALEVTEPLVPRPIHAVNTTPAYLFRKVSDEAGPPTILYDEIDTVFGPRAKDNEEIRGMLNAGHRRGAKAGRCVVRGKEIFTEELPAYCAVAIAGLHDLPDTLMSRSVVVRMRRRAPHEAIDAFRYRIHSGEGNVIRDALADWAATLDEIAWPKMPDGVEDRDADIWEPLLAVADAAGGDWPERARCAAVTLVTDSKAAPPSLGVRLLADLRSVFEEKDADHLFTTDILGALVAMDEAPWADLYGKPIDARGLAKRLRPYGVERRSVRIGNLTGKGYDKADLIDPWSRYVPDVTDVTDGRDDEGEDTDPSGSLSPPPQASVTSVTPSHSVFDRDEF